MALAGESRQRSPRRIVIAASRCTTELGGEFASLAKAPVIGRLEGVPPAAGSPRPPSAKTIGADGKVSDGAFAAASGYMLIKAGCRVLVGGDKLAVYETFDAMAAMAGAKQ